MIENLTEFCRLFYASTFIPVTFIRRTEDRIDSFPSVMQKFDITPQKVDRLLHFSKNPECCVTKCFSYLGYVEAVRDHSYIIIGPVFSTPVSEQSIRDFMHEWAIPPEYRTDITTFLENTPPVSYDRFLHILSYLTLCLNDTEIDIREHFTLKDSNLENISLLHSDLVFNAKETGVIHNSYEFERSFLNCIQEGDVERLRKVLDQSNLGISVGTVADNSLRQEKNLFISAITLATRSAVSGGLDIEQAYSLADVYIQECEKMYDIESILSLSSAAMIDYAKRVSQNKIPAGMSQEIFDCVHFIHNHTHESIQISDVAAYVGRSRSYITSKFKEELGFDMSSFVMRCKLEEAKSLLTYSEKTLSEISSYLCFSSQSYFQNVFKKKYGLTPMQYRRQTKKH